MAMMGLFSVCLFLVVSSGLSFPEQDIPNVTPDVLDALLKEKNYDLFSKLLKIDNVNLVRPSERERTLDPRFHVDLEFGDILLPKEYREQSRQGIRLDKYQGNKWQNGEIPYAISSDFNPDERNRIESAISVWNRRVKCLRLIPYNGHKDYVMVINGNGCYSYLGKIGGQQALSLQKDGCVYQGTILHEFMHACGYSHEQNRWDRDEYIRMNWGNIPQEWQSQYQKTNPDDFGLHGCYDYQSVMHYPVNAPGTNKPAFKVLRKDVDESSIGWKQDFSEIDLEKIHFQYCAK